GDPRVWMEKYFDAFLYVANWGTHWLMLRFPRRVLELKTAKSYCRAKSATATAKGDFVILSFDSEDESGDGWDDDGTGWLSSLIPLRADIAADSLQDEHSGKATFVERLRKAACSPLVRPMIRTRAQTEGPRGGVTVSV